MRVECAHEAHIVDVAVRRGLVRVRARVRFGGRVKVRVRVRVRG